MAGRGKMPKIGGQNGPIKGDFPKEKVLGVNSKGNVL